METCKKQKIPKQNACIFPKQYSCDETRDFYIRRFRENSIKLATNSVRALWNEQVKQTDKIKHGRCCLLEQQTVAEINHCKNFHTLNKHWFAVLQNPWHSISSSTRSELVCTDFVWRSCYWSTIKLPMIVFV